MNSHSTDDRDAQGDEELKGHLKASLTHTSPTDTQALQARVLVQWHQSRPQPALMVSNGSAASLQMAWRQHPLRWLGALLLIAASIWWMRASHDPVLEELMQPDVLTLISAGEL